MVCAFFFFFSTFFSKTFTHLNQRAETSSVPALLVTGYYGALSDRMGRKFVLAITVLGSILEMLMLILTQKFQDIVGIRLLFVAPVIRGLTGGLSTSIATSQAYVSDCTQPSDKFVPAF